jgi:hypothetical protein
MWDDKARDFNDCDLGFADYSQSANPGVVPSWVQGASIDYEFRFSGGPGGSYFASGSSYIESSYMYGTKSGLPDLIAHAADWYAYGQIDSSLADEGILFESDLCTTGAYERRKFNAHSTGLQFRRYGKWESSPPAKTSTRNTVNALGDLTPVYNPTMPDNVASSCDTSTAVVTEGYYATNPTLVLKWNVDGGEGALGLRHVDWTAT